jgi:hypothetical protein
MFKVAIKGVPMFPKNEKSQEFPWEGVPWLVSSRTLVMTFLCTGSSLAGLFMSEKVSHTNSGEQWYKNPCLLGGSSTLSREIPGVLPNQHEAIG